MSFRDANLALLKMLCSDLTSGSGRGLGTTAMEKLTPFFFFESVRASLWDICAHHGPVFFLCFMAYMGH